MDRFPPHMQAQAEALLERETRERGERALLDPAFWADSLDDDKAIRADAPDAIARCMANLDRACRGEQIAIDAITTALSQLRRSARNEAEEYPE